VHRSRPPRHLNSVKYLSPKAARDHAVRRSLAGSVLIAGLILAFAGSLVRKKPLNLLPRSPRLLQNPPQSRIQSVGTRHSNDFSGSRHCLHSGRFRAAGASCAFAALPRKNSAGKSVSNSRGDSPSALKWRRLRGDCSCQRFCRQSVPVDAKTATVIRIWFSAWNTREAKNHDQSQTNLGRRLHRVFLCAFLKRSG